MVGIKLPEAVRLYIKKYRYGIMMFLLGIFLLLLPGRNEQVSAPEVSKGNNEPISLQQELETLLSQMEGAGKVRVLLTEAAGERKIYQLDDTSDSGESTRSIRRETVIISGPDRGEDGLVQQTLPPCYLGAVVLCQGAESASIRLAIIEAVSRATGLASCNISVLKMK